MSTTTSLPEVFTVGERVHWKLWTDVLPGTVVKVSPRRVVVREDHSERDPEWTPEWVPGGFAGHCTNNHDQRRLITEDPAGVLRTFTLRRAPKRVREYNHLTGDQCAVWVEVGGSWRDGPVLRSGWRAFHDYNF